MTPTEPTPSYKVDSILDGWFGEPLEHAEDEDSKRRYLYGPLRKLEDELIRLRAQLAVIDSNQQ
jgi:hypothetical protein